MWAAELLKQSRGISPPVDGLVSRNPEPEGWQAASLLSAVSPASRAQMCLGPGLLAADRCPRLLFIAGGGGAGRGTCFPGRGLYSFPGSLSAD